MSSFQSFSFEKDVLQRESPADPLFCAEDALFLREKRPVMSSSPLIVSSKKSCQEASAALVLFKDRTKKRRLRDTRHQLTSIDILRLLLLFFVFEYDIR